MLEKTEEQKFVGWVHGQGGQCLKLVIDGQRGWPDRTVYLDGHVLHFEFKTPRGRVRADQVKRINWLNGHGYFAQVVTSCEEAKGWVQWKQDCEPTSWKLSIF